MKTLLVRADADAAMGTGHLIRSLALAQAWQNKGGDIVIITHCPNKSLAERIKDGFEDIVFLDEPWPSKKDPESWLHVVSSKRPVALVMDGYHLDIRYQNLVRECLQPKSVLLLLDDFQNRSQYNVDIILNQNVTDPLNQLIHPYPPGVGTLLGPKYALLRPDFQRYRVEKKPSSPNVLQILITFGGSDPDNLSEWILGILKDIHVCEVEIDLVIGATNDHLKSLEKTSQTCKFPVRMHKNVRDMAKLMVKADLAISAAGSTCWELACLGVPTCVVATVDNQQVVVEALQAKDAALFLGWQQELEEKRVKQLLTNFMSESGKRLTMLQHGRSLVDGKGAARVAREITALLERKSTGMKTASKDELVLRRAVWQDRAWIYQWRNHPKTRQYFRNSHPLAFNEHCRWFSSVLTDCYRDILVLEGKGPMGVIRFDCDVAAKTADISVYVDPGQHGKGYGKKVLVAGLQWLQKNRQDEVKKTTAFVHEENRASRRLFQSLDFENIDGIYTKTMI